MNHLVFVIFDSARYDHFIAAQTRWMKKLGRIQRRYSYASWTAPSHIAYSMGALPHRSLRKTFASRAYTEDLLQWKERLDLRRLKFSDFLPELSLPAALKARGYQTHALVSLPMLNRHTAFGSVFDSHSLMPRHNQFLEMIEQLDFSSGHPQFYMLNVGETHYPYTLPGEDAGHLPRISGFHGVLGALDSRRNRARNTTQPFFSRRELRAMKAKQIECIEYVDQLLEALYARCPENTWIILTSDHGELFGESGYFGHGPIFHEKLFEVPFVEGLRP